MSDQNKTDFSATDSPKPVFWKVYAGNSKTEILAPDIRRARFLAIQLFPDEARILILAK